MSSILVTGGAGFIGSHVADALLTRGHAVTILDDLSGGFETNVPPGASFVLGSVTDDALVTRTVAAGRFDYVYHLAAYAAEGLSHFVRRFNYTNNVIGSVNVINAAVNGGVTGIVFASSIAVYGPTSELPVTEAAPLQPADPYGIAKYAIECDLRACRDLFGLPFMVFRPHNVYGPRQNVGDRYRNVVGIFMNQILRHKPMTIFGDGAQTRAFSYIDDVASVMADAVTTPAAWNQVFNIGADSACTVRELATRVAVAMGVPAEIVHLESRHEAMHARADHEAVRRVFGARPQTSLDEGLRRMAEWVRQHGARSSSPFAHLEIAERLPASWAT